MTVIAGYLQAKGSRWENMCCVVKCSVIHAGFFIMGVGFLESMFPALEGTVGLLKQEAFPVVAIFIYPMLNVVSCPT